MFLAYIRAEHRVGLVHQRGQSGKRGRNSDEEEERQSTNLGRLRNGASPYHAEPHFRRFRPEWPPERWTPGAVILGKRSGSTLSHTFQDSQKENHSPKGCAKYPPS